MFVADVVDGVAEFFLEFEGALYGVFFVVGVEEDELFAVVAEERDFVAVVGVGNLAEAVAGGEERILEEDGVQVGQVAAVAPAQAEEGGVFVVRGAVEINFDGAVRKAVRQYEQHGRQNEVAPVGHKIHPHGKRRKPQKNPQPEQRDVVADDVGLFHPLNYLI